MLFQIHFNGKNQTCNGVDLVPKFFSSLKFVKLLSELRPIRKIYRTLFT